MNINQFLPAILLLLLATSAVRADASVPVMNATAVAPGAIAIDGNLDEAAWLAAPASSPFVSLATAAGKTLPAETTFKLLRDDEAIYIGVFCREPLMEKLSDAPMDDGGLLVVRDCVEIFLDPENSGTSYYQFMLSAGNTKTSFRFIESGNTTVGEYDSLWESAIHKGADFWTAEVRLPLTAFYHTPAAAFSDTWLFNVARERQPVYELTTWTPLRSGFHAISKFNRVGNMPRKRSRFDLAVARVGAVIHTAAGDSWEGTVEVGTTATKETAGIYQLSLTANGQPLGAPRRVEIVEGSSTLRIPGLPFAKLGKTHVCAELATPGGERIAAARYWVRLEYEPLTIDVTSPFYRNNIYPGQSVDSIAGRIIPRLPAEQLRGAAIRVSFSGPGVEQSAVLTGGSTASFSFPAADLIVGDYTLTAEVRHGDDLLASQSVPIRKLPPAPGVSVFVETNLNLVVDGRPRFVRGWYGNHIYMVSQALRDRYGDRPDSPHVNFWDAMISAEPGRLDRTEGAVREKQDVRPSDKVFAELRRLVDANRTNRNALVYYLSDEPECRGLSPVYLRHAYRFLRAADPYRPVMIITRAPELFTECADILNPHPYNNPHLDPVSGQRSMESPKRTRDQIRTVLRAGRGRIPAWLTPQAFSYDFSDPQAQAPTFREYSCIQYVAVANGCKGFTPFMYCAHFNYPSLRVAPNFVFESLALLEPLLLDPAPPLPATVNAPDDGVDVMVRRVGTQTVVIAVNLLDRPVKATITCAALRGVQSLTGLRQPTVAKPADGVLSLAFEPYQPLVLCDPPLGAGLTTEADAEREIAALAARIRTPQPGNLLRARAGDVEWASSDTYIADKLLTSLADGWTDTFGWVNWTRPLPGQWVELRFLKDPPLFRTLVFHTATIMDMDIQIRNGENWGTLREVRGNTGRTITVNVDPPVRQEALRFLFLKARSGAKAELYEIEMYAGNDLEK